jgi:hypothetical protein
MRLRLAALATVASLLVGCEYLGCRLVYEHRQCN